MGQNLKWHMHPLNQYVSNIISGNDSGSTATTTLTASLSSASSHIASAGSLPLSPASSSYISSSGAATTSTATATATVVIAAAASAIQQQFQNISNALNDHITSAASSPSLAYLTAAAASINNSTTNDPNYGNQLHQPQYQQPWNWWFFLLATLYCIVVFGGVFGNASLIITLYTQSSARLRNPLLVAVCVADLLVSGIAAPISIVTIAMLLHQNNGSRSTPSVFACKSTHFLQVNILLIYPPTYIDTHDLHIRIVRIA